MALNNWMSAYQDRTLGEMILPGSHDAGTAKHHIDLTIAGTNSNSATQEKTITEQLQIGTRFFDLRLKTTGGWFSPKKVVAHHTTMGQGATSDIKVDKVLWDAAVFCMTNKTEVVIIRISHTSSSTHVENIVKASGAGALHTGTGNLVTKQLSDIVGTGGGLICILDEDKFGPVIDQANGVHGYTKYKTSQANPQGISTCGCYGGTHKLHGVICDALKGQYEHNVKHGHKNEHLWQVYWQKTYKNPMSLRGIEDGTKKGLTTDKHGHVHGGTHAGTKKMIELMNNMGTAGFSSKKRDYKVGTEKHGPFGLLERDVMYSDLPFRQYGLPNVISYDFVNRATNQEIIDLNAKGLQVHGGGG